MEWEVVGSFFIAMLAITNPLGKIALWIRSSHDEDRPVRLRLAALVTLTAFGILALFLVAGEAFLNLFGIDLASFRVGGGVVILLLGLDMLRGDILQLEVEQEDVGERPPSWTVAKTRFRKIAVPLVVPLMAGPGAISTVVVYSSRADDAVTYAALAVVLAVVMLILFAVLMAGRRVERAAGSLVLDIQTRLFGLLLAGIAVQLIAHGIGELFPGLLGPGSPILDDLRDAP